MGERKWRRINRVYRWGIGIWIGRRYFHLRRPHGPRVFSERYGGAWCRDAFGWRLTIRTEARDAG